MRYIIFRGYKLKVLQLIFVLIAFILLICLGTWQLMRLDYKNRLEESIGSSLAKGPVNYSESSNMPYQYIELQGHFIHAKTVFLYGRRSSGSEKDGYYVLTSFLPVNSDKLILVARGWISHSDKDKYIEDLKSQDKYGEYNEDLRKANIKDLVDLYSRMNKAYSTINVITMPYEKSNFMMLDNDIDNNIWFFVDKNDAINNLYSNNDKHYMIQVDLSNDQNEMIKPISKYVVLHIRNDHLEYAITWYSLAVFLSIIYIMYVRKENKHNID